MAAKRRNRLIVRSSPVLCGPDDESDAACSCRVAVMRAYTSMLTSGAPRTVALDAAVRVYCYHHPDDPADQASHTVEHWVYAGHLN